VDSQSVGTICSAIAGLVAVGEGLSCSVLGGDSAVGPGVEDLGAPHGDADPVVVGGAEVVGAVGWDGDVAGPADGEVIGGHLGPRRAAAPREIDAGVLVDHRWDVNLVRDANPASLIAVVRRASLATPLASRPESVG
jgi:hypothetical protein